MSRGVGEDGGRVFSDERCGPDAKVVSGITSKKRSTPTSSAPRPKRVAKPAEELKALSAQCDAGDMKACKEWTLGGGPNLLRQNERKAELECEAGSLVACEERYCKDRVDADCRARVLRTAKLAGEDWYLREEHRGEMRVALPPAHLAREKAEAVLRKIGAAEQQHRDAERQYLRQP